MAGRTSLEGCVVGVVGVLERDGRYLMIQRAAGLLAGGKWCFPGGGIEPDESPADAIVREVLEEVGLRATAGEKLWEWRREDGRLTLYWWRIFCEEGELMLNPQEVQAVRWMTEGEIRAHPDILPNNVVFFDYLRAAISRGPGGDEPSLFHG